MRIAVIFIFLLHFHLTDAQEFKAALQLGLNASQIDGDQFSGYNKLGLHGGLYIGYPINDSWELSSGIFYDQLGSQKELQVGSATPEEQQKIQLAYINVPLLVVWKPKSTSTWLNKLNINFGIQNGYLIDSKIQDRPDDLILSFFKKWNLSGLFGIDYELSESVFLSIQSNESINFLFNNDKEPSINSNSLRNRWLSFSLSKIL